MDKKYSIFLVLLFSLFVGGIFVGTVVESVTAPEQEFSQLENRYLAKAPKLSVETVLDGSFMTNAEKYINDHVVGRDLWVEWKAWCERLSGKKENNGVYLGSQETLINRLEEPDEEQLEKNAEFVNQLVNHVDIPVYFGLIPSSAAIWQDRLPKGAPTADEQAIITELYEQVQTHTIDLYTNLNNHNQEEIYYRTDHHWTSLGAYYGYEAMMQALGMTPLPLDEKNKVTVSEEFYGTIFSTSGVRWVAPDHIDRYISGDGLKVTAYPEGTPVDSTLYVDSYLEVKDKYSSFLGGNQPLCVIETQLTDAPKVLIIRDSYTDSLAPFLTQNFSEIHLFDPRLNLTSVKDYVAQNEIDTVIVLYSISNFVSADNLFVLAR